MKTSPTFLKYLIWPGIVLLTAGLVVGLLNSWTLVAVALLVIGLMLMVSGIASGDFNVFSARFWKRRSTQAGTNAVVSVFSVLVILVLINFLGARYDHRVDLTEGQLLTLSEASQTVVAALEQPTKVVIFDVAPNPVDQQLLENYKRFNGDFDYQYINPELQPQVARQFDVRSFGEVFVQAEASGDTAERTLPVQLVSEQERLSERLLTNKLVQIGQQDISVVYFLQGHGEYAIDGSQAGMFEAAARLQDENFTVAPLNLAETGGIPADADVVIIAGPREQLFEPEVIAVRNYLERGGSLFVLVDPQVETGLEVMMSQWGVVPEETVVIDTSAGGQQVGLGPAAPLVTDYGNHPITEAFDNGRSFFPYARPLQIREVPNVAESALLFTNQESHAEPDSVATPGLDIDKPPEGPFALGVALERPAVVDPDDVPSDLSSEDSAIEESATEESAAEDSVEEDSTAEGSVEEGSVEEGSVEEDSVAEETLEGERSIAENADTEPLGEEDATAQTNEAEIEADSPALAELEAEIAEATEERDEAGATEGLAPANLAPKDSRMVVIGNSTFATDGLFDQQLNGDIFLNSVGWLSQSDRPTLSIRPKEPTNRRLSMTARQQIVLILLALVVFPLLGLIGSGTIWAIRR